MAQVEEATRNKDLLRFLEESQKEARERSEALRERVEELDKRAELAQTFLRRLART